MKAGSRMTPSVEPGILGKAAYLIGFRLPMSTGALCVVLAALVLLAMSVHVRDRHRGLDHTREHRLADDLAARAPSSPRRED